MQTFSLRLDYDSAAACISEEIYLDLCWRKDISRVKGQSLITNRIFYEFVQPMTYVPSFSSKY